MAYTYGVYESHSMDFTSKVEHAQRADGQWFTRWMSRGRYGYAWGAWRKTTSRPDGAFINLKSRVRLPKD